MAKKSKVYSIKEIKQKALKAGVSLKKKNDGTLIVRYVESFYGLDSYGKDFKRLTKNLRIMRSLLAPHGYVYKEQKINYSGYPSIVKVQGIYEKRGY